jgi:hypothetical protein
VLCAHTAGEGATIFQQAWRSRLDAIIDMGHALASPTPLLLEQGSAAGSSPRSLACPRHVRRSVVSFLVGGSPPKGSPVGTRLRQAPPPAGVPPRDPA